MLAPARLEGQARCCLWGYKELKISIRLLMFLEMSKLNLQACTEALNASPKRKEETVKCISTVGILTLGNECWSCLGVGVK